MQDIEKRLLQESTKEDFYIMKDYIKNSSCRFEEGDLQFLVAPRVYTKKTVEVLEKAVEVFNGILKKVISAFKSDSTYRELFGFSKQLEELILLPKQYPCDIPIARYDIFFNPENSDFKFCEVNTDGASAMNEDREIFNAFTKTNLYKSLSKNFAINSFELIDSLVDEFLKIYSTSKNKKEKPQVAIVDFLDKGTKSEFEVFRSAFIKKGINAKICELKKLKFENDILLDDDGFRIDAIYRRAVTSDCMENLHLIRPFIRAVKQEAVCLIGDFTTQIAHNKKLFYILHLPKTTDFLGEGEKQFIKKHIPKTVLLDCKSTLEIENKNHLIIKPSDKYASKGVFAGADYQEKEWKKIIKAAVKKGDYILQEFVMPYSFQSAVFNKGKKEVKSFNSLSGLFVYGGKLKGFYARAFRSLTTATSHGVVQCSVVI